MARHQLQCELAEARHHHRGSKIGWRTIATCARAALGEAWNPGRFWEPKTLRHSQAEPVSAYPELGEQLTLIKLTSWAGQVLSAGQVSTVS